MTPERRKYLTDKAREYREKKKLDLGLKESASESTAPRIEMKVGESDQHPVYPELKKWADREYDESGLVLKEQRCSLCSRMWSASIKIECPYCHGKGIKTIA